MVTIHCEAGCLLASDKEAICDNPCFPSEKVWRAFDVLLAFIVPYYEGLDLGRCGESELLAAAAEASAALRKFLADLLEEGYASTEALLRERTEAVDRLQRFLSGALRVLGPPPERERFYLMREPVGVWIPSADKAFAGASETGLHDYLDDLKARSDGPVDISDCFDDPLQMRNWQDRTARIMAEMAGFLRGLDDWLTARPDMVPVPLLRDTLLIYLGLTWLGRQPRPLFISRAFADTWGDDYRVHDLLTDLVHRVLLEQGACSLATMRRRFAEQLRGVPGVAPFTRACRQQLASLAAAGSPVFIESGAQGTFILPLLPFSGPAADMLLYTTVPWLYGTYAPIVYQRNYNYLREMETIVAHDHLFRFSAWRGGTVYVTETTDERIRRLASYEIDTFKQLIDRGFRGGASVDLRVG